MQSFTDRKEKNQTDEHAGMQKRGNYILSLIFF